MALIAAQVHPQEVGPPATPQAPTPPPNLAAPVPAANAAPGAPLADSTSASAQPIDLATTLRLAGMNDIDLALVREAENQAKAANDAATLRFFPWLNAGAGYLKETGAAQAFGGQVSFVPEKRYQRSLALNLPLDL